MNSNTRIESFQLSTGAQNQINYIANSIIRGTVNWSLFNTTLTNKIPTGSITAGASSLAISATQTNPLLGSSNLQITSAGAITAGHGFISDAFTLNREDIAKVLSARFAYEVVSGLSDMGFSGTSSNTWAVYLYDVANSAWVQPAGVYSMTQGVGPAKTPSITFQTAANATSYRLAVICVTASGGATSTNFNDLYVGPQYVATGTPVTDWSAWTPTGSWVSNTTYTGFRRRIGDTEQYKIQVSLSGAPTSASLSINLPLAVDTSKMPTSDSDVGRAYVTDSSPGENYFATVRWQTGAPTAVSLVTETANTTYLTVDPFNQTTPVTFASGDSLVIEFELPIAGWSSNVSMSSDTDTRVVDFLAAKLTTQACTANVTNITYPSVIRDSHGAWNGTDTYTVPVAGDYLVTSGIQISSSVCQAQLYVNSASYVRIVSLSDTSFKRGSALIPGLKAGDTITIRITASLTVEGAVVTDGHSLAIQRLSGPSVVAASDSVNAHYNGATASLTGSYSLVTYTNRDFDSHDAYLSGTYTIPVSGKYMISCKITGSAGGANNLGLSIFKNGSEYSSSFGRDSVGSVTNFAAVTDLIFCNAGDLITIRAFSDGSAPSVSVSNFRNTFSINRIGN